MVTDLAMLFVDPRPIGNTAQVVTHLFMVLLIVASKFVPCRKGLDRHELANKARFLSKLSQCSCLVALITDLPSLWKLPIPFRSQDHEHLNLTGATPPKWYAPTRMFIAHYIHDFHGTTRHMCIKYDSLTLTLVVQQSVMITRYHRAPGDMALSVCTDRRSGSWVYAQQPTPEELDTLANEYKLDRTLLSDATDPYEVPRFEVEDGAPYFYTRYPSGEGGDSVTAPILVAVADDAVVTVVNAPLPFLDRLTDPKTAPLTTERTALFIALASAINDAYARRITDIRREVQRSRTSFRGIKNSDIVAFVSLEYVLNESLGALQPTREALATILAGKHLSVREEDTDLIEDLVLTTGQLIGMAKASLKTMQNVRSAYSAVMTNKLNQTIQFLTSLTIILMLPTIVSSFYGMNVHLPGGEHELAFVSVVFITLALMLGALYAFRRKEWL